MKETLFIGEWKKEHEKKEKGKKIRRRSECFCCMVY